MPASPHLERFTLTEDDRAIDVVALTHQDLDGVECVLLVREDAFDDPDPDMDAWVMAVEDDPRGGRRLAELPEELVDRAWETVEDLLSLTFSEEPSP